MAERILVERLHHELDAGGVAGHLAFCEKMLPYLQGLAALLPRLTQEGAEPVAVAEVRALNVAAEERGVPLRDALTEALGLYDRVRQELITQVSDKDRPIVAVLTQFSQTLLAVSRDSVTGQERAADQGRVPSPSVTHMNHLDSETGLATRQYFEERFGEEILRAQRLQKVVSLVLLEIDRSRLPHSLAGQELDHQTVRNMAASLLAQTRGFDLAARLDGDAFALLLPETGRAGAAAILGRLARGTEGQPQTDQMLQFRVGIAVYPKDGETVHALMQHAENVLRQNPELP
jgi:diguanylate cyclase (GGDEF)-like protein